MNSRLNQKNILITGASGGIGERMARKCAENGANLILVARNFQRLQLIKSELEQLYSINVQIFQVDIGQLDELERVFEQIQQATSSIDILVNNAGFGMFKSVLDTDMKEVNDMFSVNVLGLIAVTKWVLPQMVKQGSGHIINIASQAGKISTPKSAVYSATKKAVLGFTDSLRMEVKDAGIYVTSVNPGPIATNFFNIADESGDYLKNVSRWVLDPDEVAEKIVGKMLSNTREINLPKLMNTGSMFYQMFPSFVELVGRKAFFKK